MRAITSGARPALAAVLIAASAGFARPAAALPASQFSEYASGLSRTAEGDDTLPETISLAYDVPGWGSVLGSAATIGGALPRGEMQLELNAYVDPFNPLNGQALAAIRYYWAVEQVGGDPFDGRVPVDVETHGRVFSVVNTASGGIGNLYAEAFFEIAGDTNHLYQANACLGVDCETGEFVFDEQFTVETTLNAANRVDLTVGGNGQLQNVGSFSFEGFVDPRIEISPSFARRADFQLVFSNEVVPEPEAGWLSVAALAAIAFVSSSVRRAGG